MITIGTDSEIFAKNKTKHKAICGLIGGTKEKPLPIKELNDKYAKRGFAIQEDNVSVEFNIPPSINKEMFQSYVKDSVSNVEQVLRKKKLEISTKSAVFFDKKELTHPQALVFGCEPDYNAWTLEENEKPQAPDKTLRTAGGHVHVGAKVDMVSLIRAMDIFLGLPSILIDDSKESVIRRQLYGKAGSMRPKPYGAEYRVLSNFWIFDDKLINWVYESTYKAIQVAVNAAFVKNVLSSPTIRASVVSAINTGDKKEVETLLKQFEMPTKLRV